MQFGMLNSKMKRKHKSKNEDASRMDAHMDLKSLIREHSAFFDKLIELIPARFYLPNDDQERPWFPGLSKADQTLAKKESRENIKKARRERMDPEKVSKTTLDLLQENLEKEKANGESDDEHEVEIKPMTSAMQGVERSVTYEELQERLHRKIEGFQAVRKSTNPERAQKREKRRIARAQKRQKKRNLKEQQKKRKRDSVSDEVSAKNGKSLGHKKKDVTDIKKNVAEAAKELAFSHVKLGNDEKHRTKKRKLSKSEELEKAMKLEEAKKDPEKGEIVLKKHSWKAATSRAAGIKVHDDPKLLKQSIRKEKKKQEKNAGKWKERVETTEKMKAEKQQKRSENIAGRIHDKKMRRIAKREKKLMRPGFEGRKEGYINEAST